MLKVYNCVAYAHDLKLVGLAAVICVLASLTAINLLRHARRSTGNMRTVWLAVSAISTGFGIWATHFVAMLAFTPGIPSGYNITLTALSLVAAILLTGVGLAASLIPNWRHGPWVGGAIVAGGIAAMHYTGMAAFEVAGIEQWDPVLVATSILMGVALGAIALPVGLHGTEEKWKIGGAVLLTLAICSHHFTAMAAVSIIPDQAIEVPASTLPATWLALAVAMASFVIIGLALAAIVLDIRDSRRSELEVDRMRDLADASVEGLLVCDGETIVSVNTSFALLAGVSASGLVGVGLERCFPDKVARARLLAGSNQTVETSLRHRDGTMTPVELLLRPIVFSGRPHHVVAVRDLQARKEAEQHIHYLAHHDALTSLPNRGYLQCTDRPGNCRSVRRRKPCRALPRSRPVQGNQRSVRACRRRHGAADGGHARHRGARRTSDDGAARRRRIRRPDARREEPGSRRPARRDHSGGAARSQRRAGNQLHLDQHRHRHLPRRRDGP
jgi:PAS domain S-box-containing protein